MKTVTDTHFFKSDSNPGREYQVIVWSDGLLSCDCPAWTKGIKSWAVNTATGQKERTCKHVRKVQFGMMRNAADGKPIVKPQTKPTKPQPETEKIGRKFSFD